MGKKMDHCRRGHPLVESNVYVNAFDGRRRCKTCMKAYQKRKYIMRSGIYEPVTPIAKPRAAPKFYNPAWPGVH